MPRFIKPLFLSLIYTLLNLHLAAQGSGCPQIDAGPNQTLPCNQTCTNVTANVFDVGLTDSYTVGSIPHAPPIAYGAGGGTAVSVNTDDVWSGVINLPFPFCFYGATYNSCIIGSNGALNFNTSAAGGYHPWPFSASVPSPALSSAGNIFTPYHDIDPSEGGSVRWYLTGSAPCRVFVVSYDNIPHYNCTNLRSSHMVVLYETTNIIEVYVNNKFTCGGWNSGNTVIGIQNPAGTVGLTPPGRNTGSWSVNTPEAWQFKPSGTPIYSTVEWYEGGTLLGTGTTFNVCPSPPQSTYTARTTYTRCDGFQIIEQDDVTINYDAVTVSVSPSSTFTCAGSSTTITASSPSATNYLWTPGGMTTPSISVSPLSTTTYTVTATNSQNGCSETANATVSIAQPVSSACNVLYVTPTGSPTAAGSKADPMDLLTALEKGACNGTVVKMAVGTYTTDTTIQRVTSFITLEGGFDPAINWDKISTPGATRILRTATQSTSIVSGNGIDNEAGANPEVVAIAIANQSGFRFQDLTIEVSGLGGGTTYSGYNGVDIVGTRLQNCANYNYVRTQVIAGSASNGANQIWSIPATNGGNSTGVELLANGLNGVILNCNIQAGAGGNGGTGGGAAGSSNQLTVTGTGLSVNDPSFNLAGQEYIRMDDVSCTATNMDFSGTPSWTWLFGTGSTPPSAVGNLVTTQYNSLGRKTISYGSNSYEGFANIILDDQINPTFSTSAPFLLGQYRVCAGSTVDFTSTNGGVGYIYSWDLGGGATGQNIFNGTSFNSVSGVFDTPGIYTISLNYETNCCGLSAPTTLVLYVEEQPIAGLPGDQDICLGVFGGASLTATGLTTNGSVSWSPSTGLNASDTTTVIALPANTTDYTVTLSDSTGICTSSDTVRVNVIDLQLAMSSTSANCITLGTASVVVTGGSGSYSYTWSNGGGNTATLTSLQPGLYTVFVSDNTLGCADSASVNVPAGPGALTATLSATHILCAGENDGAVTASVSGGTPPYTYNWIPLGTSVTSTNTIDSITGLTQGTYTLDLVDDLGCTFSISVDVEESGPLVFVVDSAGNTSCSGVNDGFIEISTDGGERPYSFTWNTGMPAIEINDAVVASNLSPGTYVLTVVDDFGCTDSISLTLNPGPVLTSIIDTVICYGENYVFPGGGSVNLFMDTNAIDSLVSLDGCDSVVFTNVTVPQLLIEAIDTTICQGQSLTINGTTYIANGSYNDTARYVANGCDSIQFVIDLQIDSVQVENIDTTLCQGQSLTVNGTTYTATGVYNDTASYVLSGCDSIQFVIDLQIDSVQVENIDTTLCQGQSLTVNGTTYSATGIYNDTLRYAASSCDSIQFVIDLQIDSVQVDNIDTTLCQGQSLTVNGTTYTATGIYNDTARYVASGCDSIQFVIDLQIDSVQVDNIDTTLCQGQSLTVNGTTYSASGIYNDTLRYAASGCDSIQFVIDLQIDSVQVDNIDTTLCQGLSLTVNGTTYSATGVYNDTLRYVASGCDSIQFVIDLQIDSVQVETIDTTLCQGQSLTVNGTTYTATGVYNDTASYVASGCDSIQFVIDLQIDSVQVDNIDTTLCQGQSLTVNGTTYSATGIYNDTLRYVASGCDSIQFVIDLQIDSVQVENIDTTLCQGQSLTVNGTTYTTTGIYNDTARYVASGCDSIQYVIDLQIDSVLISVIDATICDGDFITINGVNYSTNVTNVLDTSRYALSNCDSVLYDITVTVNPLDALAIDTTICQGQDYTFNGTTYTSNGVYYDTLFGIDTTLAKIDSTVSLPVLPTTNPSYGVQAPALYSAYNTSGAALPDASANGFSFEDLLDPFWTGNGVVANSIVNSLGYWDAAVPDFQWFGASFSINVPTTSTYYVMLAADNSFRFSVDGSILITSDDVLMTAAGNTTALPQTIPFIRLHIYPIVLSQGCHVITIEGNNAGGPGMFAGAVLNNTPAEITAATSNSDLNYIFSTATASSFSNGAPNFVCPPNSFALGGSDCDSCRLLICDTVVTINLNIDSFIVENIDTTICQGQSLTVNGTTYTVTGLYNDTARYAQSGCDSIQYVIDLEIDSFIVTNIDTTICQGQSLTVNGTTYTASGLYNDTASYVFSGCDSIQYVIDLEIDSFLVENIDTTLCQGQSLTVNGTTYTASGLYNDTASYVFSGCDSIQYVIDLSIDSFLVENIDTTICQGQTLTVNGVTYTATGLYNDTASYVFSGCDSIQYVIDLQIDSFLVENIDTTICQGQTLTVNGATYSATGLYNDTASYTLSGCDSIQYVIDLSIDSFIIDNRDTSICQGESITVNGITYNATGIYNDTLRYAASGCDSIQFVIDLTVTPLPVVIANSSEPDSAACINESVSLFGSGTPGVTYTWDNGVVDNVNFNLPLGTSGYIVTGEDALGCISADTISVEGYPIYDIAVNTEICEDENYTLPDGSVVNTAGVYTSNLNTVNGCDSIITTTLGVNLLGIVDSLEPIIVCNGLSQTIAIETQNITSFEWFVNDGSGSQSLLGNSNYIGASTAALDFNLDTSLHQNVYTVVMVDECGNSYSESTTLEVYLAENVANPVADTTFCDNEIDVVTIDYNGTDYQWSNGDFGPSILVEESGEFIVNFIENGTNCLLSDTINITVEDCIGNCVVLAPTGFSPNASGANDIFRVVTTCEEEFSSFSFAVFDRWGQLVYSTDDWREGWDGTFRGRNAEIGTYTYTLSYVKALTNKKETLSGNVTLIR